MMQNSSNKDDRAVQEQLWRLATAVRDGCFSEAVTAYEDASNDGLCHEGAWECALSAMRDLDFRQILAKAAAEQQRG